CEARLIQRNGWSSLEVSQKCSRPNSSDAEECGNRPPSDIKMFGMQTGRDRPPHINDVRDKDTPCDTGQNLVSPFNRTHQQQEKWDEEVEEKQKYANPAPAVGDAIEVPRN